MTRPERYTALVCVLFALAAVLLSACVQAPRLPAEPDYPCERVENGEKVYFACDVGTWLEQQPKSRESKR